MRRHKPEPREEPDQLRRYQRDLRLSLPGRRYQRVRGQMRRILQRLRRAAVRERVPFIAGKGTTRGACHYSVERHRGAYWIFWGVRDDFHAVRAVGVDHSR